MDSGLVAMTASRAFAVVGLALAVAGAVGAIIVRVATQAPFLPVTFGFGQAAMVAFITMGLSWASIGAFLVIRRPENAVGSVMVVAGAGYALSMLFLALTFAFAADGTAQGRHLAELAGWTTVLCTQFGAAVFLIGFIFPTGRAQSPRWASLVRLSWPFMILFGAALLLQPGSLHLFPTLENPFGLGPDFRAGASVSPLIGLFSMVLAPCVVLSLAFRYRTASHTERQQLKWFGLALVIALSGVGFSAIGAGLANRTPDEVGLTVYGFAAAGVPVAIAIAILRHRLYDIDRIISRTLSYGAVTAVLAIVFGLVGGGLGIVLGSLAEGQTIAVAGSTLLVVALFGPLRRRARTVVDRRFDRSNYDASVTVQAMTARLRDDVDIDRVEADVLVVLDQTFHPTKASMWIRGGSR
jgi:hypothetical protein